MVDQFVQCSLNNGVVRLNTVKSHPAGFTDKSIVIKTLYIGICRADIKEVSSSRDIPEDRGPLFGHEFIGQVIEVGKNSILQKDDYVTFNPNVTPKRTTAYSEYFFIEEKNDVLKKSLINIDKDLITVPWMPEPFACIVHSVKTLMGLSGLREFSGKKIGIIGAGNSGIIFGFYFKYLGGDVVLLNRGKMRLDFIDSHKLFQKEEFDSLDNYNKYLNNFDIVIVVPTRINTDVLSIAEEIVNNECYMHLYGGTRKGDKFKNTNLDIDHIRRDETKEHCKTDSKSFWVSGAYGCDDTDFDEAILLYKNHNELFPIQKMVSKVISFQEFPNLIMDMALGKCDFPGKVLVRP